MKTIVLEQPGSLTLSETEMPAARQEHAVLRIRRIGICGTDYHAFNGNQPFFTYPRILGHELSGEIVSIESAASSFKPGDQVSVIPYLVCGTCIACRSDKTNCCTSLQVLGVHTDGGMREYLSVPAANLIAVNGLDLDQAAIIEPLSIGAHAVRRAGLQPGESVLVIGGGPIGLGVMAFAKQQGAKVIAMDINQERLDFCTRWVQGRCSGECVQRPCRQTCGIDRRGSSDNSVRCHGQPSVDGKRLSIRCPWRQAGLCRFGQIRYFFPRSGFPQERTDAACKPQCDQGRLPHRYRSFEKRRC